MFAFLLVLLYFLFLFLFFLFFFFTSLSSLENSKSETSSETQESEHVSTNDNSWFHDGWRHDEWNDGWSYDVDWSSVGWHEGCKQTRDTSTSSFSLGGVDLGATRSPKRFTWLKMNLDTGAAVNTFPLNFGPEGTEDERFFRTASGEWIADGGAWQFQGYDANGLLGRLNGRLTVYTRCCAVLQRSRAKEIGELAWKERTHSSVSREQQFQFLPGPRSEIH